MTFWEWASGRLVDWIRRKLMQAFWVDGSSGVTMVGGTDGELYCCTSGGPMFGRRPPDTSGNAAFDKYRADTIARLNGEQAKLKGFRDRLAAAKDQAEFDQFMSEIKAEGAKPATPQETNIK